MKRIRLFIRDKIFEVRFTSRLTVHERMNMYLSVRQNLMSVANIDRFHAAHGAGNEFPFSTMSFSVLIEGVV